MFFLFAPAKTVPQGLKATRIDNVYARDKSPAYPEDELLGPCQGSTLLKANPLYLTLGDEEAEPFPVK
jgi:hypothetical protein